MKIAVTCIGDTSGMTVDPRFGRAAQLLIHDTKTGASRIVDNTQNLNAAQGAGIQTAQHVIDEGAEAVITGNCGPKAFRVLTAAGIKIYTVQDVTVKEALQACEENRLTAVSAATVEGHWV
ncbi:MAG: NifB/NifX family molybdenum-iron cluster-binding protein [Lentisphaeria bacterium]|nr:NifB/NifX family molybdenum-iron cluster-binding protein [Lentisphaeria bacterium]